MKLLLDELFGEKNFIESIVWDKKSSAKGVPPRNMIVGVHEYILAYQKTTLFKFIGEKRDESGFKNPDNDPRGPWRESNIKSTTKSIDEAFTITNPKTGKEYTNTWAFSKETLEKMIKEDRIIWKKNLPKQKEFLNNMKNDKKALKSDWGVFDNQKTTMFLKKLIPEVQFNNPKPLELMKYLVEVTVPENSIILDFFAGSGTTAQAVIEVGVNRKFILATNNENNIAQNITYARLKRIYEGTDFYEGKNFNLKYFKTKFVSKDDENLEYTLLNNVKTLIELEHGIDLEESDKATAFTLSEIRNLDLTGIRTVYVRQHSHAMMEKEDLARFKDIELVDVPEYYFAKEMREAGL